MLDQKHEAYFAFTGPGSFEWEIRPQDDYVCFGESIKDALGYPVEYFENKFSKYAELIPDEYRRAAREARAAHRDGLTNMFTVEYPLRTSSGQMRWYLIRGRFTDSSKTIARGIAIDIDEFKRRTKDFSALSYKDSLTGLSNMRYIIDGFIAEKSGSFENLGGLLCDIKDFKSINEIFGFEFGDELLASAAKYLGESFPDIPIIRVSGDRFLLVFENITEQLLIGYAEKILDVTRRTLTVQGQTVVMDAHIGIAFIKEPDAVKLLSDTETALFFAKQNDAQGSSFCVLSDSLRVSYFNQSKMKADLRKAVTDNEFVLYYQPIIDISESKIASCEALIRWNHPQKGVIQPLEFIRFAEETGLIVPIGEFVINEAAAQLRRWLDAKLDIVMSINLSPRQFFSPQLCSCIKEAVDHYRIPPHKFVIEVTESVMIADISNIKVVLDELSSYGVDVALDDFGTGYSSLSYLGKMPLNYIKIDRSFVVNAALNKPDYSILHAIVNLSFALGYDIIAEGVENFRQMETLKGLGCANMQGYLFSKPLPSNQFEVFVKDFEK